MGDGLKGITKTLNAAVIADLRAVQTDNFDSFRLVLYIARRLARPPGDDDEGGV